MNKKFLIASLLVVASMSAFSDGDTPAQPVPGTPTVTQPADPPAPVVEEEEEEIGADLDEAGVKPTDIAEVAEDANKAVVSTEPVPDGGKKFDTATATTPTTKPGVPIPAPVEETPVDEEEEPVIAADVDKYAADNNLTELPKVVKTAEEANIPEPEPAKTVSPEEKKRLEVVKTLTGPELTTIDKVIPGFKDAVEKLQSDATDLANKTAAENKATQAYNDIETAENAKKAAAKTEIQTIENEITTIKTTDPKLQAANTNLGDKQRDAALKKTDLDAKVQDLKDKEAALTLKEEELAKAAEKVNEVEIETGKKAIELEEKVKEFEKNIGEAATIKPEIDRLHGELTVLNADLEAKKLLKQTAEQNKAAAEQDKATAEQNKAAAEEAKATADKAVETALVEVEKANEGVKEQVAAKEKEKEAKNEIVKKAEEAIKVAAEVKADAIAKAAEDYTAARADVAAAVVPFLPVVTEDFKKLESKVDTINSGNADGIKVNKEAIAKLDADKADMDAVDFVIEVANDNAAKLDIIEPKLEGKVDKIELAIVKSGIQEQFDTAQTERTVNKKAIATNAKAIAANKAKVEAVEGKVEENKTAIAANKEKVKEVEGKVEAVEGKVKENSNAIAANKEAIEENKKELGNKVDKTALAAQGNSVGLAREVATRKSEIARVDRRIDNLDKKVNRGMSLMAAMTAIDFQHIEKGELSVGAGLGYFGGSQGVAVGVAFRPNENLHINAKYSVSADDVKTSAVGLGVTYRIHKFD